ncbi:MAG: hypothetical protein LBC29_05625 [Propionibacteriaceae bacterium]|nr:hypothetical protein [Propionibacteriaceae bacterium]
MQSSVSLLSQLQLRFVTAVRICALLLVPPAVFVACSVEEPVKENPYEAEFAQAMAEAPNEYQRDILADGVITRVEVLDAHSRVVECVNASDLGISAGFEEDTSGAFSFTSRVSGEEETATQSEVVSRCYSQWAGEIDGLYSSIIINPNNEDPDALFVACLIRHELVPAGFTTEDYKELYAEWQEKYGSNYGLSEDALAEIEAAGHMSLGSDSALRGIDGVTCEGWCSDDPTPPFVLPGGLTRDDPEFGACMVSPLR